MTAFILIGFGIPLFTYSALFWGRIIRAGVIFALKQIPKETAHARRPRPAVRAWVVDSRTAEVLPADRRD